MANMLDTIGLVIFGLIIALPFALLGFTVVRDFILNKNDKDGL